MIFFTEIPVAIELKEDSFTSDDLKPWLGWSTTRGEILTSLTELNATKKNTKTTKKKVTSGGRLKGNFPCDKCGRTYIRKDSLQRHLQWECGKEPQFQCPFCPQKCKRKAHQIRHIKRQHKDMIGLVNENNPDFQYEVTTVE